MDMRNEIRHEALGILIEEELRRAGVNIAAMCDEMHMGHTTTIAKSKNSRPKNKMCH